MSRRKKNIAVDLIECEDTPSGGFGIVVTPEGGGADTTNNRSIIQPKSSVGSGNRITASGILHTGPCTLNRVVFNGTVAGTFDIADAIAGGGTTLFVIPVAVGGGQSYDFGGAAFGTGVYATFNTVAGGITALVGPAVS
jgi:hypothetical protein